MGSNITIVSLLLRIVIWLLQYLHFIFFIIRDWKWTEEKRPKRRLNKIWICQVNWFFLLFTICDYVIPSLPSLTYYFPSTPKEFFKNIYFVVYDQTRSSLRERFDQPNYEICVNLDLED